MANFEPCFEKVLALEGGYKLHNVSGDRGGMTYAGIARNFHPTWQGWLKIDNKEFDLDLTSLVKQFYKDNYWDKIQGDLINYQQVAFMIYDFAVNAGIKASVRITQRIVEASPDGVFGPKTLEKLNTSIEDEKDERIFVTLFSLLKVFRYKDICLNDKRRSNDFLKSNIKFYVDG